MKPDNNSSQDFVYKAYRVLGLVPVVWTIAVVIYYLVVALNIGHFPTYGNPDPNDLKNEFLKYIGAILLWLFIITFYCLIAFSVIFIIHIILSRVKKTRLKPKSILISASGFLTWIGIMFIPALNDILDWLLD